MVKPSRRCPVLARPIWLQAVSLLKAGGYDGYYSFEWEKWWHPELAEPEVAFPAYKAFCDGLA